MTMHHATARRPIRPQPTRPMIRFAATVAAALAAVLPAACDNPVQIDEHADEVAGVQVMSGQTELARVLNGVVTGRLTVAAGSSLGPLTIRFIAEDGDEVTEPDTYLETDVGNTAVAEFTPTSAGAFAGQLAGKTAGTTAISFKLMHGAVGAGHADFTSAAIPVEVTP